MKSQLSLIVLFFFYFASAATVMAVGLEERTITLSSNDRFDFVQAKNVKFKFKPLSEDARKLEITNEASSLGVAYLGQVKLKENNTALSALRSIADQIGESLGVNFGVITDSNTSDALKANELLLLYHPHATITLALAKPSKENDYEIICTYALKDLSIQQVSENSDASQEIENQQEVSAETKTEN